MLCETKLYEKIAESSDWCFKIGSLFSLSFFLDFLFGIESSGRKKENFELRNLEWKCWEWQKKYRENLVRRERKGYVWVKGVL